MLEVLVHLEVETMPPPFRLLEVDAPDGLPHAAHDAPAPADAACRRWGDAWLGEGGAALARVPSAVAPRAWNWLLNPAHPDAARVTLVAHQRWPWDARLWR